MPLLSAVPVVLSAGERRTLKERVRGAKTAWRDRLRAQIVLAAARGHPNARIAAGLGISVDTVRKWRGRFAGRGLDGLAGRHRPGRPRRISAADRAAVVASDLHDLMDRISRNEQQQDTRDEPIPQAA